MELGEAPPAAPRTLPKGFAFRQKWSQNMGTVIGGAMFLVALIIFSAFLSVKSFGALVAVPLLLVGGIVFWKGWRSGCGVLKAFRSGVAVEGRVASVRLDETQSINQRHPWVMTYHFAVGESLMEGSLTSFNSTLGTRSSGQSLWVLYAADDPAQNTIYPPV